MTDILNQLAELLGEQGFIQGEVLKDHPAGAMGLAKALIRPTTTGQLSAVLAPE